MLRKTLFLLSLLAVSFLALSGCQGLPTPPQVDICVILVSGNARCFPKNQPGEKEYFLPQDRLMGGFWISAQDYGEVQKYIVELEEIIKSRRAGNN